MLGPPVTAHGVRLRGTTAAGRVWGRKQQKKVCLLPSCTFQHTLPAAMPGASECFSTVSCIPPALHCTSHVPQSTSGTKIPLHKSNPTHLSVTAAVTQSTSDARSEGLISTTSERKASSPWPPSQTLHSDRNLCLPPSRILHSLLLLQCRQSVIISATEWPLNTAYFTSSSSWLTKPNPSPTPSLPPLLLPPLFLTPLPAPAAAAAPLPAADCLGEARVAL